MPVFERPLYFQLQYRYSPQNQTKYWSIPMKPYFPLVEIAGEDSDTCDESSAESLHPMKVNMAPIIRMPQHIALIFLLYILISPL